MRSYRNEPRTLKNKIEEYLILIFWGVLIWFCQIKPMIDLYHYVTN